MKLSYLDLMTTDPSYNLAMEQYVFDCLPRDRMYFMLWQNDNAIIVGKYQNTIAEINEEAVRERGIRVVRRLSGGGAVYHDMGNLNFTFITDVGESNALDLKLFCEPVVRTLATLGVKAEVNGRNDITIDGKKFSGNSQYIRQGRVMHHGTIMFDSDLSVVSEALRVDPTKIQTKGIRSVRSRVTNVAEHLPEKVTLPEFRRILLENILKENPGEAYPLTQDDLAAVEKLRAERATVSAQLVRSRMGADPLLLRQREGFLSANPAGGSQLASFAERVLPARSVANLYPMNYSGKTDPKGFFIGRDRFGSNIIVDFDRRASDKTNASALILGNTGQGKSYLLKLLLCNVREAGKSVISLDSEHEMEDECRALGGCFLDYLSGQYRINLLEPRCWDDGSGPEDPDAPDAFRGTLLSQHISFLRDVFRVYKGFDTPHIDTLELMVEQLYKKWNITDHTDFAAMRPEDYPILSDLYDTIQDAYDNYDAAGLYPREMLRDLLLGLHSMCRGADARFFNGHTNIDRSKFLVFCVKGLDNMAENLRNTLLFSLLSYMSDQLLTQGNSVAAIDELYLWLSDPTVITYIRNALKRVRKKESALFLASQNLEDFTQPGIRELTRPLFSIPVHQFIFNGGNVDKKFFMDNLQLEESEYALIRDPQRGSCLYKCGNERYLLQVQAPEYKQALFGTAGGR